MQQGRGVGNFVDIEHAGFKRVRPARVVDSDSETEEEADECPQHDERDVQRMQTLLRLIEFAVRNVPLSDNFLSTASPIYESLRAQTRYFFSKSLSASWKPDFVWLLKRTRAFRVVFAMPQAKAELQHRPGHCAVCGRAEYVADAFLELLGGDEKHALENYSAHDLNAAYDQLDDDDELLRSQANTRVPDMYFGAFALGRTCMNAAVTALLAKNFLSALFDDVRDLLEERLRDPATLEQWERDEREGNAVDALFDTRERAIEVLDRLALLGNRVRGDFSDETPSSFGRAAIWDSVGRRLATTPLRVCAARAHALLGLAQPTGDPMRIDVDPDEEEFADAPAPTEPIAKRLRSARENNGPISSRLRRR